MHKFCTRCALCVAVLSLLGLRSLAQEPLTNESVVKMVKAGLPQEIVIQTIQSRPAQYLLDPDNLVELHQQGIPGPVLSAMIAAQKQSAAAISNGLREGSRDTGAPYHENVWEVHNDIDRMSGNRNFSAVLYEASTSNRERKGEFRVTATCTDESLDFKVAFQADAEPKFGFKQTGGPALGGPGGVVGALAGHVQPWVDMRVRTDEEPPVFVASSDDYLNEVTVSFSRQPISNITRTLAPKRWAGTAAQALKAKSILIELPLADGNNSILEIKPQDQSFAPIASRCTALNPDVPRTDAPPTRPFSAADKYALILDQFNGAPASLKFTGSVETFAAALDGFFRTAAVESRRDPAIYTSEIAFIKDFAQKCFAITPEMVQAHESVNLQYMKHLDIRYRKCLAGGGSATAFGFISVKAVSRVVAVYRHGMPFGLTRPLSLCRKTASSVYNHEA